MELLEGYQGWLECIQKHASHANFGNKQECILNPRSLVQANNWS